MKLLVQINLEGANLEAFEAYEAAVLPLLADHGGVLEQRLRGLDHPIEIHLLTFPSAEAYQAYLSDPRRLAHAGLKARSGARTTSLEVGDMLDQRATEAG